MTQNAREILLLGAVCALASPAFAAGWQDQVSFSGAAAADVRFNIEDYRGAVPGDGYNFAMNRNDLDLRLEVTPSEKAIAVLDARLRYFGFNEATRLSETTSRDRVDPFSVQVDEAFVSVRGVPHPAVDLKIGRMVQTWGSADMFNPTDNLSSRDFSDPIDYSRKVPNQMLQIDVYPSDWLTLTAVWVPVFKPSQLPDSAPLGFGIERDAAGCLVGAPAPPLRDRADAQALANLFGAVNPCALNFGDPEVRTFGVGRGIAESQAALRAKMQLGSLDLTLSYYYGRFSFPVAYTAVAFVESSQQPGKMDVRYLAEVTYPRMQVAGIDFSYNADWLFGLGIVGELALIFPEEIIFGLRAYQGGNKLLEMASVNVPDEPFFKATLGLDYTFTPWLYVNAMWVHGFFDEFNDVYGLHDYAVVAPELKFLKDELKLRLSSVYDITDGSSAFNPTLTWIAVPAVEVTLGAFVFGGSTRPEDPLDYASRSKFGQKAAGRSVAFFKTRVNW
ncbi:MAG: hypothetical protein ACOX6T_07770 [Myxococcales bacterium]|jgi:hypothetical protein